MHLRTFAISAGYIGKKNIKTVPFAKLNRWSFAEIKRQIQYKAAWEGVPVIQLSKGQLRGASPLCPRCGKMITQVVRKKRQFWCAGCKKWMDRDVAAARNPSIKGLARFASSQGAAGNHEGQSDDARNPQSQCKQAKSSFKNNQKL